MKIKTKALPYEQVLEKKMPRHRKPVEYYCKLPEDIGNRQVFVVDPMLAACDEKLNEHAYIVPGLGDAGDRIFGTK